MAITDHTDELAGLPEEVRVALAWLKAGTRPKTRSLDGWKTVRAELLRLARENAELREHRRWNVERSPGGIVVCYGDHDKSDACEWQNFVPIERAERAEAELAALKRRIERTPKVEVFALEDVVDPDGSTIWCIARTTVYGGRYGNARLPKAWKDGQRVALLPVGGE